MVGLVIHVLHVLHVLHGLREHIVHNKHRALILASLI